MEPINILAGTAIFAILYSFIDAWHDEKVINGEKIKILSITIDWHTVDSILKGIVSLFIGILFWFFTKDYILGGVAFFTILLIRAGTFNFFLNRLMNYPKGHRRKKGIDKIPTWIWWILLAVLIAFTIFRYYSVGA